MIETNLVSILRNSVDELYEVLPFNSNQDLIRRVYRQLINPEATILNDILKKDARIKDNNYQFHRIVIILTMISDFFEYCTYNHYKEEVDSISDEIYQVLNNDCDFKKAINIFFQNGIYAKKIIENYILSDQKDKNRCIDCILEGGQIEKLLKINPYITVNYMDQLCNKSSEKDNIINILKECSIADDNEKMKRILDSDSIYINEEKKVGLISNQNIILDDDLNSNKYLKQSFLTKLKSYYNGNQKKINDAIRYVIYDVLNGMIKLSNNNLVDKDNMKKILNVTDANLDNQEKIVEEFVNNADFSNAVLDIFNDIHYTYDKIIDLFKEDNISDDTKKFIKKYNPFD